ncbi:MAG: ATP-dependent helicase [Lachnospiraceae bacterium]|nr:ATP-dependent helicase [Lachnospiraceae bacterium]
MSLVLVTGGSGCGKTEYIYRKLIEQSVAEPDGHFFLIVPEQATMQAQKEIVRLHPRQGTMNLDIVSFERLAYRIFSELSLPQPEILDDTGKTMVLRRLAGERKEELILFAPHLNRAGFIDEIKSMLSEFYQYGVTPDLLKEKLHADGVSRLLERKLEDMGILYRAFQDFIKERYITMEELLDRLCAVAARSRLLNGSVVVLDGYTGFTPVQYRLVSLLLRICRRVYVTVTVPSGAELYGPGNESDLFDMSRKLAGRLAALSKELGVLKEPDIELSARPFPRFQESPALGALEQTLFRYPCRPYPGKTEEIRLVQAKHPRDEVNFVINQIELLVKRDGLRYREIALVCGDLPGYSRELLHQFEENGIPLFVDEKRDVSGNPLIRLIKSALELLWKGFDYESMFRYLRTGLVTEEREQTDRLEQYVRAMGIRGFKRWSGSWDQVCEAYRSFHLMELDTFRQTIMGPLTAFKEKAGERGASVSVITEGLTELLRALGVEEKLARKSDTFRQAGMHQEAREYEEIYNLVMELFGRLCELLGEEAVSKREYTEIVSAGFGELSVGMIPAGADRVVAGDLKRTRLDKVKALFFLGVNEGVVPADTGKGGILTEQEREVLKRNDLELAPTAREEGFMQRFYLYRMLTKPEKRLTLSFSALSAEGKTMRPSSIIGHIRKRFPGLSVFSSGELKEAEAGICPARQAVIEWLQKPEDLQRNPFAASLYRWLSREGGQSERMEQLAAACSYACKHQGIGREAARELYGNLLNGSVTRMEGYAACAYAHFLTYGLELKRQREYELDFADMGNLFHSSIDLFFTKVREQGKDFAALTTRERQSLVKSCVADVSAGYRNTIMKSSARNAYLERKVERIVDRTVRALIYQLGQGDFEPEAFEVDVSTRIALRDGAALNLRGRIDRLDVLEDEDHVYVKIMDYKSGSTSFDLALLYHGLQLQLVVYMDAAMRMEEKKRPGKEAVPAGMFYYHIDDPVLERKDDMQPEEIEAGILKKLRMNGLVNSNLEVIRHLDREIETESDVIPVAVKNGIIQEAKSSVAGTARFVGLSGFVRGKLKDMGEEILDGNTSVNPYKQGQRTACDYCPYHSVCGFDLKTGGYSFRKLASMKPEEVWEKIEETKEDENAASMSAGAGSMTGAEGKGERTGTMQEEEGGGKNG